MTSPAAAYSECRHVVQKPPMAPTHLTLWQLEQLTDLVESYYEDGDFSEVWIELTQDPYGMQTFVVWASELGTEEEIADCYWLHDEDADHVASRITVDQAKRYPDAVLNSAR